MVTLSRGRLSAMPACCASSPSAGSVSSSSSGTDDSSGCTSAVLLTPKPLVSVISCFFGSAFAMTPMSSSPTAPSVGQSASYPTTICPSISTAISATESLR